MGENASSIRLHEKCGFTLVGTEIEVGRKHGRWLDVVEYQYVVPRRRLGRRFARFELLLGPGPLRPATHGHEQYSPEDGDGQGDEQGVGVHKARQELATARQADERSGDRRASKSQKCSRPW